MFDEIAGKKGSIRQLSQDQYLNLNTFFQLRHWETDKSDQYFNVAQKKHQTSNQINEEVLLETLSGNKIRNSKWVVESIVLS